MPWIHRDEEVAMLLWAVDDARVGGSVNACTPDPITNRELSRTLGRVLHRPAVMPVPKLAVAALRGSELADAVTSSQRVVPRRALDLGYPYRFPELEPALRDLLGIPAA
jgi:NAD dependent epimerase/dehydratase family enzyme